MTKEQDKKVEEYREKVRKANEGLPEAGAIAFRKIMVDGDEYNATHRANNIYDAVTALRLGEKLLHEIYGNPPTMQTPSPPQIQEVDELGTPVVDGDGKAIMVNLPPGTHQFPIKEVYKGTNKDKTKELFKVVLAVPYEFCSDKYGINCFDVPEAYSDWKSWVADAKHPPVEGAKFVIVNDPKEGAKFPTIGGFSG